MAKQRTISVPGQPGNSHRLTAALAVKGLNVRDARGFVLQPPRIAVCCIEIDKPQMAKAGDVVRQARFVVLADEDRCGL